MVERWRWDQGRLQYFRFENLKKISKCLVALEGIELSKATDNLIREVFTSQTSLPFSAGPNGVWRNYARIFKCTLLAVEVEGKLRVTDVCHRLAAKDSMDVDEYLSFWIPRFYLPSPAFEGYTFSASQVFPLCAVLKYLLASFLKNGVASLSSQQVFSLIIGNQCSGLETLQHYTALRATNQKVERQVREMLIFVSQMSWLKWSEKSLHLDILLGDKQNIEDLTSIIEPIRNTRNGIPQIEILSLGEITTEISKPISLRTREVPDDILFTEGSKIRVTHLRTERSPQLRKLFFSRNLPICDMCECDTRYKYPWTKNLLEIHHLLPLSSAITITSNGTSLEDIVGLCPNCHRSVHVYYKRWLESNSVNDFSSKDEAKAVYRLARESIKI